MLEELLRRLCFLCPAGFETFFIWDCGRAGLHDKTIIPAGSGADRDQEVDLWKKLWTGGWNSFL